MGKGLTIWQCVVGIVFFSGIAVIKITMWNELPWFFKYISLPITIFSVLIFILLLIGFLLKWDDRAE